MKECCARTIRNNKQFKFCPYCGEKVTGRLYVTGERMLDKRVFTAGEFRCPKKGEFFISGVRPVAYEAFHDMSRPYRIAVEVTQS